jgi:hypothetical protein
MAATDLRRKGLNNQKREVRVISVPLTGAEVAGDGSIYATLPPSALVIHGAVTTTTAGAGSSTVVIEIAGAAHGSPSATAAAGSVINGTAKLFATGGNVVVKAGATAPGTNFVGQLDLCYIEHAQVNGEYTVG